MFISILMKLFNIRVQDSRWDFVPFFIFQPIVLFNFVTPPVSKLNVNEYSNEILYKRKEK